MIREARSRGSVQIRAYLNERPPLSGKITVADFLQPSRLKLGV